MEATIGFDLRSTIPDPSWTADRRTRFLLRRDVAAVRSVDPLVWERPPGFPRAQEAGQEHNRQAGFRRSAAGQFSSAGDCRGIMPFRWRRYLLRAWAAWLGHGQMHGRFRASLIAATRVSRFGTS
jgi:hypothetical protein